MTQGRVRPSGRLEKLRQQNGYYDNLLDMPDPQLTESEVTDLPLSELVVAEIRAWMARNRVTGQMLARRLGTSDTYVSRRLRGLTAIDFNELEQIAQIIGVPISTLVDRAIHTADERFVLRRRAAERATTERDAAAAATTPGATAEKRCCYSNADQTVRSLPARHGMVTDPGPSIGGHRAA